MEPDLLAYDLGTGVRAFSTGRAGGFSTGPFASFNANAFCGDDMRAVRLNREGLCRFLGLDVSRLVIPRQVHGTCVRRVGEAFFRLAAAERDAALDGVDAVMTDLPQTCVAVSTADCMPLLFHDAAHHAVAAVHAGWRGTLRRIPEVALQAMSEAYGTCPADVRVAIGPGISLAAFEVGEEVYDAFREAGFPMEEVTRRFPAGGGHAEKWHIDLLRANEGLLSHCGVPVSNVRRAGICTYLHPERFFSARRLGVRSGRILNGIFLTE